MNIHARLFSAALVLLGVTLSAAVPAQTPVNTRPPDLTIRWLSSMAVSPTIATAGTKFTATVKLMRPAAGDLRVDLGLVGGAAVEGVGFALDGVVVPQFVTVPTGKDQATFTITTSGPATWVGTKKFTATAACSSDRLSAGFTVNRIVNR